jgi:hypothetical protein
VDEVAFGAALAVVTGFGAAALLPLALLDDVGSLAGSLPLLSFPNPPLGKIEPLPVTADLSVGPPTAIFVFGSSTSILLSGFIGGASALELAAWAGSKFDICAGESKRGDSGIGCSLRLVFASASPFLPSGEECGLSYDVVLDSVGVSRSPLSFRVDPATLESRLVSLCSPIRPSFSIAMKFVRILEIGLGDSVPAVGERRG